MSDLLHSVGFEAGKESALSERRKSYPDSASLQRDLLARTGRSILHELSDTELESLVDYVASRIPQEGGIDEIDYWTVWSATKPKNKKQQL